MNIDELKKKSPEDLNRELDSLELDLLRLNAQSASGGKDAGRVRELKRTVARIKTLQSVVKKKEVKANK